MYTNNDFERLFIRYKAERLPNNESISALRYLKAFFREIALGRSDYENLMPMTIGNYSAND